MTPLQNVFVLLLLSSNILLCQYNYLCDFSTKFTSNTAGNWNPESSTCQVTQTYQSASGAVTWLGGDTSTKSWTDYTIESTLRITSSNNNGWTGLIFRATSIGNNWDSGNYYFVALLDDDDRIYNVKFYNNDFQQQTSSYTPISRNTDYTLRIDVSGNSWTIYLNGVQRHSGSDNYNPFPAGSIGLRCYQTVVVFKTLYITLPTTAPTPTPTNNPSPSPIPSPTDNPTPSPTDNPTSSPTDNPTPSPTNNPTRTPTMYPPTISPTTSPTTSQPTTAVPTTMMPTNVPSTNEPTTSKPTTPLPTTSNPTKQPTTNEPTTKSPMNILSFPLSTPSPTLGEGGVDNDGISTTNIADNTDSNDNDDKKIMGNGILVLDDWMFIVGGAVFAVFCMTCTVLLICVCKQIMKKKPNKYQANSNNKKHNATYNATAEMVKVASVSHVHTKHHQNNIINVSTAEDTGSPNDTPTEPNDITQGFNDDIVNNMSSGSNVGLSINQMSAAMGFDDDFINTAGNPSVVNTQITLKNNDSIIVDTFNDPNNDMIIESNDDEMTKGQTKQEEEEEHETLGNYED